MTKTMRRLSLGIDEIKKALGADEVIGVGKPKGPLGMLALGQWFSRRQARLRQERDERPETPH